MFYGQHEEDRLLAERFDQKRDGFFVEVGALDGVTLSNTAYFERELGWTGVLVEANPEQARLCQIARPASVVVAVAATSPDEAGRTVQFEVVDGYEAMSTRARTPWARQTIDDLAYLQGSPITVRATDVPTSTLDEILTDAGVSEIDFVSIDVEGFEWSVLQGFSLGSRWNPTVLLIERAGMPESEIVRYMWRAGYSFLRSVAGNNDWYERAGPVDRIQGIVRLYAAAIVPSSRRGVRRMIARAGLLPAARYVKGLLRGKH